MSPKSSTNGVLLIYLYDVICAGTPAETDTIKATSKFNANMLCHKNPTPTLKLKYRKASPVGCSVLLQQCRKTSYCNSYFKAHWPHPGPSLFACGYTARQHVLFTLTHGSVKIRLLLWLQIQYKILNITCTLRLVLGCVIKIVGKKKNVRTRNIIFQRAASVLSPHQYMFQQIL